MGVQGTDLKRDLAEPHADVANFKYIESVTVGRRRGVPDVRVLRMSQGAMAFEYPSIKGS
jgi:hypothetical protein